MKKIIDLIKKHKVISTLVVIGLIVGSIYLFSDRDTTSSIASVSTTKLTRQTINQTVTANGIVESADVYEVNGSGLTSSLSTVSKVNVAVGDYVKKGDVLGQFDTSDTDKSISDAKTNLENAKKTKQDNIDNAQKNLDSAIATRNAHRATNQTTIDSEKEKLDSAQAQIDSLNSAYLNKKEIYDNLVANNASPDEIAFAKTEMDEAERLFNEYSSSVDIDDLKSKLQAAETAYSNQDRTDTLSVDSAQRSLDSAKNNNTTIDLYQSQLDSLYETKAESKIVAPISGTVTEVNAKPGSSQSISLTGTSALFIIQDLTNLQVPVNISEYDVVDLKVGMKADILSDAFLGENWTGEITSISPVAIDTNKNFKVTVKITSEVNRLTAGMSAKMNIIIDSKENVFAVPYDAVIKNDEGQDVVYVLDQTIETNEKYLTENWIQIKVTTGMETDYYLEISSNDLKEGMEVVNDPNFRNSSNRFIDRISD